MNILGQPFAPWVTKQIKVRQESLGYKNYGESDLKYQNVKTPWIRLASTVEIKASDNNDGLLEKLGSFGIPKSQIEGPNAARNFILQGGAVSINANNYKTYSGLNDGSFYSGAYGWGGTTEKGFVPLPGIIDASLVYYNNGALSKAVVNMKCYNRNQLALMDALYMRPGYNLLLEFGWSTYLDNNGVLQTFDKFQSAALEKMLSECPNGSSDNTPANFEIPRLIRKGRKDHDGNYEGVFGKITNFKWEFNPDGSYNCQTTITGMGGVIEALKIGGATPLKFSDIVNVNSDAIDFSTSEKARLDSLSVSNAQLVGDGVGEAITNALPLYTKLNLVIDQIYRETTATYLPNITDINGGVLTVQNYDKTVTGLPIPDGKNGVKRLDLNIFDAVYMHDEVNSDGAELRNPTMYLSLGYFFALLQKDFLIYNDFGDPLFTFDIDFPLLAKTPGQGGKDRYDKMDSNFIQHLPGQISSNPTVCFVPFTEVTDGAVNGAWDMSENVIHLNHFSKMSKLNKHFKVSGNPYVGRLMYVYVNYEFIKKLIKESPRTKDNNLVMLSFLQAMFSGISDALGGINRIEVFEDTSDNKIKFIENIPQNWEGAVPPLSEATEFCKLNTFGVKNNVEGSIVKNLELNASISKEFAAMVSIGAQNNGNQVNENATAFSNYNKGLIDRTFQEKLTENPTSIAQTETPGDSLKKNNDKLRKLYKEKLSNSDTVTRTGGKKIRKGLIYEIYNNSTWTTENLTALESNNKTWANLLQGCYAEAGQIQGSFFLPFNLSLDIEGISGIKLFQKFEVDDNVLPPSYAPNSVDIQIKAANHTVNNKEWTTKLETQSIPKPPSNPSCDEYVAKVNKTKRRSFVQNDIEEVEEPTLETIDSKFPLSRIFFDTVTPKKQIYLHHTVSDQDIKSVIDGWNRRTDRVSTHYVSNNSGKIEQLYEDDFWAYHLGVKRPTFAAAKLPYQNLNRTSIGIELCSYGGLTAKFSNNDDDGAPYEDLIYRNAFGEVVNSSNVIQAVDKNGNPITYKGYKYFEKYSDAQIKAVKGKLQELMSKYNIPFKYDYDVLFGTDGVSRAALSGEKGIYTHNSVRPDKSDVFPQKELIEMLKSIATEVVE